VASGGYAIYPAALNASQSLFLEPWLNLFCLLGAVLLFDGDRIAGLGEPGQLDRHHRRALWAGICFGFAAAVKIWAGIPALVAWVLCLTAQRGRRPRPALSFAGGFAAGILVPCLPFEILAPNGFGRTVFVSELVQATHGRVDANPRVTDITGIIGLSSVGVNPLYLVGRHGSRRRVPVRGRRLGLTAARLGTPGQPWLGTPGQPWLGTPGQPRRDKPGSPAAISPVRDRAESGWTPWPWCSRR
jgi:hypothetical protein